jgi:hypothetical protein
MYYIFPDRYDAMIFEEFDIIGEIDDYSLYFRLCKFNELLFSVHCNNYKYNSIDERFYHSKEYKWCNYPFTIVQYMMINCIIIKAGRDFLKYLFNVNEIYMVINRMEIIDFKEMIKFCRYLLIGEFSGLGLFDICYLLGREKVNKRFYMISDNVFKV